MLLCAQEKILRSSTNISPAPRGASSTGRAVESWRKARVKEQIRYIDKASPFLHLA